MRAAAMAPSSRARSAATAAEPLSAVRTRRFTRLWLVLAKRRSFVFGTRNSRSAISFRVSGSRSAAGVVALDGAIQDGQEVDDRERGAHARHRVDEPLQALERAQILGLAEGAFARPGEREVDRHGADQALARAGEVAPHVGARVEEAQIVGVDDDARDRSAAASVSATHDDQDRRRMAGREAPRGGQQALDGARERAAHARRQPCASRGRRRAAAGSRAARGRP